MLAAAPPVEDFATAWLDLRRGMHAAKDRKRRTLEWCLFEAVRDRELSFLGKATHQYNAGCTQWSVVDQVLGH